MSAYAVEQNYNDKGFFIDERNQVNNSSLHVNYDGELTMKPAATIVPFDRYITGALRSPSKTPYISGYNAYYSYRKVHSFNKEDFINVFCAANKSSKGMDCYDDNYAVTFVEAEDWSYGIMKAPIKAKMHGRKPVLFLMVHTLGADDEYITEAKKVADSVNLPVVFATIDSYLPVE